MTGSNKLKALIFAITATAALGMQPALAGGHGKKAHKTPMVETKTISSVIDIRQNLMQGIKAGTKSAGAMVKGEKKFDAKGAVLAMWAVYGSATALGHQFPAGSDKGETRAKAEIWKDKAKFNAAIAALAANSMAAVNAAGEGKEAFGAAFMKVGASCKECHSTFRAKRK